jgi:hypothetical protein
VFILPPFSDTSERYLFVIRRIIGHHCVAEIGSEVAIRTGAGAGLRRALTRRALARLSYLLNSILIAFAHPLLN